MDTPRVRDIDEDYRILCATVGHLFISFARLEGSLSAALRLHLGNQFAADVSANAGLPSAIYGSMRFRATRDVMKRIMTVEGTPKTIKAFVLGVFEQVGHIEHLRDLLAHQQTVPAEEGSPYWQITDLVTTKSLKDTRIYLVTPDMIRAASDDLVTANKKLGNFEVTDKLFISPHFDASPVPWRYKSSSLVLVPRSSGRGPLGPPPRRKPSPP